MSSDAALLESLRAEHEAARLRAETAELQASARIYEDLNKWVSPSGYLHDDSERWVHLGGYRQYGGSPNNPQPAFSTEAELATIRGTGRVFGQRNPTAIGLLESLASYVVGTGYTYSVVARDWRDDRANKIAESLSQFLESWLVENEWPQHEQDIFRQSREDGELFLRLYTQDDGMSLVRIVEPEFVTQPTDERQANSMAATEDVIADWTYGVATASQDIQRRLGYWLCWGREPRACEFVPADSMIHVKLNTRRNCKRGLSDFYPVFEGLDYVYKLTRNTTMGAAILASIVAIRKHGSSVSATQASAIRAALTTRQQQVSYPAGSRTEYEQKMNPGRFLDIGGGYEYEPPPIAAGHADTLVSVLQAALRDIGKRWCMPEYQVSGDASNANYSSTKMAGGPWQKFCERQQQIYSNAYKSLLWKALDHAVASGVVSDVRSIDEARTLCDVDITATSSADGDLGRNTERYEKLAARGIISKSTWASAEGFEYERELASGAEETESVPVYGDPGTSARDRAIAADVEREWREHYGE